MAPVKTLHNIALLLSTAALLLAGSLSLAEDPVPSGTLTLKETEVGLLLGGDWGKGTLAFDGKEHPFKLTGAKVGGTYASTAARKVFASTDSFLRCTFSFSSGRVAILRELWSHGSSHCSKC